jgi:RNA polymerase sigma factor (sigma-70 family)
VEDTKAIELLKKEPNNPKAIEHLYKKYALEVIKFITYKGANPEIAEEIFQEAFLVALEHIQRYEDNSFTNWIKTISYNLYKDYLRKLTTELNKDKENIESKREKALKDAVVTLENGIKNTQFSYLGKKQDSKREGREIYISSDEMQIYVDNHNKSIDGWNDNENIYDSRSKKIFKIALKMHLQNLQKMGVAPRMIELMF